jgi:hypothetical protein
MGFDFQVKVVGEEFVFALRGKKSGCYRVSFFQIPSSLFFYLPLRVLGGSGPKISTKGETLWKK